MWREDGHGIFSAGGEVSCEPVATGSGGTPVLPGFVRVVNAR
ncbi:hypothetical protein A33M_3813 [Rhodovulum sp. PH10]|nr:hypothetical protein A33M_3813 [Rhodovulum sp. PH10]